MRTILALSAALALSACVTAPALDSGVTVSNGDDCAVFAAVLREKYGFDQTPRYEPFVYFEGKLGVACEWARYGIAPPTIYDPQDLAWAPRAVVHISRPDYGSAGVVIDTFQRRGSRVSSWRCRVHSGFAGWTVGECELLAES